MPVTFCTFILKTKTLCYSIIIIHMVIVCTCSLADASGDVTEMIGDTNDVMYSNGTGRRTNTLIFNVTRNHYNATFVCNVTVSVFFEETFAAALDVQCK